MTIEKTIGFLGGGNMAEALVRGLVNGGHIAADRVWMSGPRAARMDQLRAAYAIHTTLDNRELAAAADIVVIAVKPHLVDRVLVEVSGHLRAGTLVISLAAGISTAAIERRLAAGARVIRSMPNTPALVGAGATAIAPGSHADAADLALARTLFDSVGITEILDETLLDAVTGLSGSGPAYIFLILEALADGGVKVGLSRRIAQKLAAQTVMGAAKLLLDTAGHPGQLKDQVTSPGGTAIAGLHTLEQGGVRTTLINAVEEATRRSRELGRAADGKDDV
jgi:pyrroline-5-carboxylate reductase